MKAIATALVALAAGAAAVPSPRDAPQQYAVQMLTMNREVFAFTEWYLISTTADGQNLVLLLNPDDDAPNGGATPLIFDGPTSDFSINFQAAQTGPSGQSVVGGLTVPGEEEALGVNPGGAGTSGFSLGPYNITDSYQLIYNNTPGGGFYVCAEEIDNLYSGKVFFGSDTSSLPSNCGVVDLVVSEYSSIVV